MSNLSSSAISKHIQQMATWTLFNLLFILYFSEWGGFAVNAEKFDNNDDVSIFLTIELLIYVEDEISLDRRLHTCRL